MVEKMDVSNADEETKKFIDFIKKEKIRVLILGYLCAVLMVIEAFLNQFMNMVPIIIGTFIFISIVHIYVLVKLDIYKINLSNILSAISNNMTIKEWAHLTPNQVMENDLKVAKLSWRSQVKDFVIIFISCFVCIGVLFISVIAPFTLK